MALSSRSRTRRRTALPGNQRLGYAFFIVSGMVSMVRTTGEGASVEVAPVGRDGMMGVPIFLDTATDPLEAFAQVLPCEALRMPVDAFRRASEQVTRSAQGDEPLHVLAVHGHGALGRLRTPAREVDERMARWLLMCHDRLEGDTLALTHEFLARSCPSAIV
jgi:CRP-like cAMP-binding protein